MKTIHGLTEPYGIKIIEDASHALGGKYDGKPVGNCMYSDISVFSFHPVKIITTGEVAWQQQETKSLPIECVYKKPWN